MKYFVIFLIKIYQRVISPRKGYSCAYRIVHGNSSCSHWAMHSIDKYNVSSTSTKLIIRRLKKCRQAYIISESENDSDNNDEKPDDKKNDPKEDCLWCSPAACFGPFFSKY